MSKVGVLLQDSSEVLILSHSVFKLSSKLKLLSRENPFSSTIWLQVLSLPPLNPPSRLKINQHPNPSKLLAPPFLGAGHMSQRQKWEGRSYHPFQPLTLEAGVPLEKILLDGEMRLFFQEG